MKANLAPERTGGRRPKIILYYTMAAHHHHHHVQAASAKCVPGRVHSCCAGHLSNVF